MLKGENIICISSIDWDFIWQGHQQIMHTLAKNGNRVLFIENTGVRAPGVRDIPRLKHRLNNWFKGTKGIRRESDNLYVYSPVILPFPYSRLARFINKRLLFPVLERWMKAMEFQDPIIWTFLPTPLTIDIMDSIANKLVVYYCIDNFSVSSGPAKKIKASEKRLFRRADLIFVTSKALHDRAAECGKKVHIFPFAVDMPVFEKARAGSTDVPPEMAAMKGPKIGYVGGVHKWIDQELVAAAAHANPGHSFIFVGPIQTDISLLAGLKNVHFLGNKKHEEVPLFIKEFDACLIPYLITDYTKNVYPTKMNEYLAMGKAVISTALPEVIDFNKEYGQAIYIARDRADFNRFIAAAVKDRADISVNKRIEIAKNNSWEKRIEDMSGLIREEIIRKKTDMESRWKENLLVFYRTARRKSLKLAAALLVGGLLVFKTPLVWFLASPLQITQVPARADAIVVFGGGVGETGSPGKSTIERARYAAELYKEGFARKIIFSSGYTFKYNDAQNMALIALSMGVPAGDIILEEKANRAYENVIFSDKLLKANSWSSILLVSSPYNMRRASLVFRKWAGDVRVLYAPVKDSEFYDRSCGIKLEQIRAVGHEYLGILYYWFKGYI